MDCRCRRAADPICRNIETRPAPPGGKATIAQRLSRRQPTYAPSCMQEGAAYLLQSPSVTEEESRPASEAMAWLRTKWEEPKQGTVKQRAESGRRDPQRAAALERLPCFEGADPDRVVGCTQKLCA